MIKAAGNDEVFHSELEAERGGAPASCFSLNSLPRYSPNTSSVRVVTGHSVFSRSSRPKQWQRRRRWWRRRWWRSLLLSPPVLSCAPMLPPVVCCEHYTSGTQELHVYITEPGVVTSSSSGELFIWLYLNLFLILISLPALNNRLWSQHPCFCLFHIYFLVYS